jgi:hypothetical protein
MLPLIVGAVEDRRADPDEEARTVDAEVVSEGSGDPTGRDAAGAPK